MQLLTELEDITTSVDIHKIYAKVKCTVGVVGLNSQVLG